MSALDAWQTQNDEYLAAALAWTRLRLERAAKPARAVSGPTALASASPTDPAASVVAPEHSRWNPFRRQSTSASPGVPPPLTSKDLPRLPPPEGASSDPFDEASRRLAAASEADPAPALLLLCRRLGLSDFERDVLLLCASMELDPRAGMLCASAQDEPRIYPTFALAMSLFDKAAWEALSPERPLRYWRLIDINQPGAQPLTASALRADERIVSFIKGLNYLDDRLSPLMTMMPAVTLDALPASQQAVARHVLAALGSSPETREPIAFLGRDRESKRQVAAAVAGAVGLHLYRMPAEMLPAHVGDLETLARLWQRESLLLPIALYIDAQDLDKSAANTVDAPLQRLARFVSRSGGLIFVATRDPLGGAIDALLSADVGNPTAVEQHALWAAALGADAADLPARLAGQFNLGQNEIASIVARARKDDSAETLADRVWLGCRARTRPMLDQLAERLDTKATWDHIVLPKAETALLRQVAAQVDSRGKVYDDWGFRARMNRGLGISALFAGESGTGKTMAAEVLANALKLDLYRIDLSAVVSKYIGETEKNLRRVFDEAEDGGAILLFDEADALFGKRSEVKDSHDRYANIEINYLLQRMEAYRGLAILATNMKSALDSAFMRRLRFIIKFPFPGAAERRQMWERAFPPDTPHGVLDLDRLSRLGVTGGTIHNIALNAAFMAARAGTPVTMGVVLESARSEFRKTDRPVNEADFRWVETVEGRA